jgi:predicted DNA repair protein MutK
MDQMGDVMAGGYYLQFSGNEEAISYVSGQKDASDAEANDDLEQG